MSPLCGFLDVCVSLFYHNVVAMRLGGVRGFSVANSHRLTLYVSKARMAESHIYFSPMATPWVMIVRQSFSP